jgi:hypothetical protein
MPETMAFAGTSFITTEFGAITALSPTVTLPITFAPTAISTLLPIVGLPGFRPPPYFLIHSP